MFKAIKSGEYDFPSPFWDDVEPGAKDMIGCLLVLDTEKRYSAEKVGSRDRGALSCRAQREGGGLDRQSPRCSAQQ